MSRSNGAKISIALSGKDGGVCLSGQANIACSVAFKNVVKHFREETIERLFIFLGSCLLMDSTFLGVLASQGIEFSGGSGGGGRRRMILVAPSPRVVDLIENLGVMDAFVVMEEGPDIAFAFQEVSLEAACDLRELSRVSLEAHRTLIGLNEGNRKRFEGVTSLLEEELRKRDSGK